MSAPVPRKRGIGPGRSRLYSIVLLSFAAFFTLGSIARDSDALLRVQNEVETTVLDSNPALPVADDIFEAENMWRPRPVIDIISVGSQTKSESQDAQERTFGTHTTVRHFFRVSELNDTDATCHSSLTPAQRQSVVVFCADEKGQTHVSGMIRNRLFKPRAHIGWLCAQKRPVDGLHLALQQYKREPLPNYLFVVDDDSYFNMDAVVQTLLTNHSEAEPHVVAGCQYHYPRNIHFVFPYGGFGTILTRKAIENLIRPISCDGPDPDAFTKMACWRLSLNLVGEKKFFRDGMSVADLMYAYSSDLPFTGIDQWKDGTGYCFHSDHTLGYFFGFYHIAVPDDKMDVNFDEKLRKTYGYGGISTGDESECDNERERCSAQSRICHYIEPQQMDQLFLEQQSMS